MSEQDKAAQNCKCEHWQTCLKCNPEWYDTNGNRIVVTKEMRGAAHDILLKKELMLPWTLIDAIYTAMRHKEPQPLYTHPKEWVGLTDEEVDEMSRVMVKGGRSVNWLARAIETKLREKNT